MSIDSKEFILAYCGLICSECGAYKKRRCKGCHSDKPMHRGCKIKPCAMEKGYVSCAECVEFDNLEECKKLNNFISKIFAFVFRSDRIGNLNHIRDVGIKQFQEERQV